MFSRLRTTWMASSGALLLVLVLAGGAWLARRLKREAGA